MIHSRQSPEQTLQLDMLHVLLYCPFPVFSVRRPSWRLLLPFSLTLLSQQHMATCCQQHSWTYLSTGRSTSTPAYCRSTGGLLQYNGQYR
jgi:hypothetical protein